MSSFNIMGFLVLEEKIYSDFNHIWGWRPSWSCDLGHLYQLLFRCTAFRQKPFRCIRLSIEYDCWSNNTAKSDTTLILVSKMVRLLVSTRCRTSHFQNKHRALTWHRPLEICFPFPRRLHMKFGLDRQSGFRGEDL